MAIKPHPQPLSYEDTAGDSGLRPLVSHKLVGRDAINRVSTFAGITKNRGAEGSELPFASSILRGEGSKERGVKRWE
ncbi:hypothetical protein NIES2101_29815 [Calothrix sp. HK-06]|nr:hypothetical protein NIES2101_29815 [Calothrix sp. HK-06]